MAGCISEVDHLCFTASVYSCVSSLHLVGHFENPKEIKRIVYQVYSDCRAAIISGTSVYHLEYDRHV